MKRSELKKEIKEFVSDCSTFDEMIHSFSIYITNNFKRRIKPIDSTKKRKAKK